MLAREVRICRDACQSRGAWQYPPGSSSERGYREIGQVSTRRAIAIGQDQKPEILFEMPPFLV